MKIIFMLSWLTLLSCGSKKNKMNALPVIPDDTKILYEKVFLDSGNYKGNFKFCFTKDGDFFYQKNTKFQNEGKGHYDNEFPTTPKLSLNEALTTRLNTIINSYDFKSLQDAYGKNSQEIERWTFFAENNEVSKSIFVFSSLRPDELQILKDQLDQLITENKVESN